jgi:hypothetical protein
MQMSLFHVASAGSVFTHSGGFHFDSTKAKKISKFPLRKLNGMEKYIDGDVEKFFLRKYLISFFS